MKQISIKNHSIVIDDCLSYMKIMDDQSIDVVCTSPPYNIGLKYNSYNDMKPKEAYLKWINDIGIQIARILKEDGSFFLNVGSTNIDPWIAFDIASSLRNVFVLQNHIIWAKSISIADDTVGHFKPINSKRFLNHTHESIFHFTLKGHTDIDRLSIGVSFKDKSNIKRRGHGQDKRCGGDIWFLPYDTVQSKKDKFDHPATFPISLPKKCIKMHGKINGIVLDPFLGSGSTLMAAEELGWTGIGIEIDSTYATIAEKRLITVLEQ